MCVCRQEEDFVGILTQRRDEEEEDEEDGMMMTMMMTFRANGCSVSGVPLERIERRVTPDNDAVGNRVDVCIGSSVSPPRSGGGIS